MIAYGKGYKNFDVQGTLGYSLLWLPFAHFRHQIAMSASLRFETCLPTRCLLRTPAEPMPPPIKEPPSPMENPDAPVREPDPEEPEQI
jgi:hypothetical protein